MALRLALSLDAAGGLRPGSEFGGTVECTNTSTSPLRIASALLDLTGTETVDPARVATTYASDRPRPTKPPGGGRGDARPLLAIPAAPLIDGADVLEAGEKRVWRVAGALPPRAPPTVAGVAVKIGYRLTAAARYAPVNDETGSTPGPWADAAASVPVVVWPPEPRARPPPGALAVGAAAAATGVVDYQPGHVVPGGDLSVVEVAPSAAGAAAAAAAAAADAPPLALSPVQRRTSTAVDDEEEEEDEGDSDGGGDAPAPPGPRSHHPTFVLRGAAGAELARLTLTAPPDGWLTPGATLRGALDLTGAAEDGGDAAAPRAVRYAASLECSETVAAPFSRPPPRGAPATARGVARRAVLDEARDEVAYLAATDFFLGVPPAAPPTQATPLVSITWTLRLEVAASAGGDGSAPPPPLLEWELPVAVYAPDE